MFLDLIIVLILVLAIATIVNTWDKKRKINNTSISFKESMDLTELPVVTFYNGDKKLNFLLDTGSNDSHINSSILSSLEYRELEGIEKSFVCAGGEATSNKMCEMEITYKNQRFVDTFCITDLDTPFETIKKEDGVQIHGILGSKFFERYKYVLDFGELIAYTK